MTATFKKRKSREDDILVQDTKTGNSNIADAQEILRRHFEAQFQPLSPVPNVEKIHTEVSEDAGIVSDNESEWSGISDSEAGVQVIEHSGKKPEEVAVMNKAEFKAFMSSKPPQTVPSNISIPKQAEDESGATEAANLKKDLALQRLLAESHLLDSAQDLVIQGKNRHVATDLRIQALGSKYSILKQAKMPMSHRKGINTKLAERESKRRKEAKENGIVLEKATKGNKKSPEIKRDRGFGAPIVGKFSRGKLQLSKKDISEIEGPRKSLLRGGGRRGLKRGRGRGGSKSGSF
ncbi:hypothetical protein K3495_g8474 [Podosphaera aphanis]|nr:hypothetical protein K3495_g8474 [Podosphaera aphanis]